MTLVTLTKPTTLMYGITEAKKAELDALSLSVINAQEKVVQLQSVVTSLTDKSNTFKADLSASADNLTVATQNQSDLADIINTANNLKNNSKIAFNEVDLADGQTKTLAIQVRNSMLELIYSAEVIDKLQNLITRKKALNPLISDDLVKMIAKAGTDANNAVALMLVALNSTFTAQASVIEARAATGLELGESVSLYQSVSEPADKTDLAKIWNLINIAYENAKARNANAADGVNDLTKQLNNANAHLMQAQIKLQSLEAGYAAANAAALAS
ncbi:MAG: hypothetical protein GQ574_13150 [Crocinitomix sp.]|nr:hypothetical protein [Crocinitomix sp.]